MSSLETVTKEIFPDEIVAKREELERIPAFTPELGNNNGGEKDIIFDNISLYEDVILKFKNKILQLVEKGIMSQQVGQKILLENEYNFFQQIVQVKYE